MTNIVQEFRLNPNNISKNKIRKPIVCRDGFKMSVQASDACYYEPRANLADGNYSEWEVATKIADEAILLPFIEGEGGEETTNVYPYVPTEIILEVIEKHGGIAQQANGKEG